MSNPICENLAYVRRFLTNHEQPQTSQLGLKIRFSPGSVGSSPTSGTKNLLRDSKNHGCVTTPLKTCARGNGAPSSDLPRICA